MELLPTTTADLDLDGNAFIARTYRILFAALAGVVLLGLASYAFLPTQLMIPLGTADGILWTLCGWFGWRRPVVVVFPIFAVVTGLFAGQVAHASPDAFLAAAILTLVAFAVLTVYVHVTRQDFSFLRPFLWAGFFLLVVGGLLGSFGHSHRGHVAYAALGTAVFLCWILYDTTQVTENAEVELTPGLAAFELILDIVALQDWLVDLLKLLTGREDEEG